MLLGTLAFAVMAVLINELKEEVSWQWIALARSSLALLFAAGLVIAGGAQFVFLRPRTLWMRSLAGSVSLLCGFYAMTHYDVSVVLTLTNMYPLWVAVLSWPLLGTLPSGDTWIAAVVGVIGVCVLSLGIPPAESYLATSTSEIQSAAPASQPLVVRPTELPRSSYSGSIAVVASLVSAFLSAVALIGLHRLHGIDARAVVTHFSGVSTSACLAAIGLSVFWQPSLIDTSVSSAVTAGSLVMLLGVGLSATVGQLFLTKAFAAGPPSRVSVIGLAQTGFAMLFELVIHQKRFSALTLLGMALILAPTAWVLLRGRTPVEETDPPT